MSKSIGSWVVCLFAALAAFAAIVQAQPQSSRVVVDTAALKLFVMRGDEVVATFDNISIGSNGTTRLKRVADERTPLGDYRIREIRDSDRFHRFLALDYPTLADAERALADGRIDRALFERIRRAWQRGETPPQDTPLGGHLGLHGIGEGSPEIHADFNWTNGCIALTNEQIDALIEHVSVGTRVRIR
jgi:lipoprotein-anchoring transpeptidase ErfK/SrfK